MPGKPNELEPQEIDRDFLLKIFFEECDEGLSAMERAVLALEAQPDDAEQARVVFRVVHTIKGNALSLGFPLLAALSHELEDHLEELREGSSPVDRLLATLLLRAVDALRVRVNDARGGAEVERPDHRGLLDSFAARRRGATQAAAPATMSDEPVEALPGAVRERTLRVDTERLDRLLDLAGEITIARGQLRELLGHDEDMRSGGSREQMRETLGELDRLSGELQETILRVRAVPIGPTLRQHVRTVRDAAALAGKQARLVVQDGGVEVDTTVVELLRDPLTHMVRNAVAHGLESPAERIAKGKDSIGTVTLRARQEGGLVVVEVVDDGAGFDRERIAAKVKKLGLAARPEELADDALFDHVFTAGFTTADNVSELSGRGVGMDVVRHNVQRLRGDVSIESKRGSGATVELRLPVSLAIVDAFFVELGEETYAVPLDAVLECLDLPAHTTRGELLDLRGEPLPLFHLRQRLGAGGAAPARESVLVVRHGRGRAGLVVDRLVGKGQTVLKPLGPVLRTARGLGGSAILGTGRVALFLDVPALLEGASTRGRPLAVPPSPAQPLRA